MINIGQAAEKQQQQQQHHQTVFFEIPGLCLGGNYLLPLPFITVCAVTCKSADDDRREERDRDRDKANSRTGGGGWGVEGRMSPRKMKRKGASERRPWGEGERGQECRLTSTYLSHLYRDT